MGINHLFYESGLPIYEYNGEFFYEGEDTDELVTEDYVSETNDSMSFRRSIGVGKYNSDSYLPIFHPTASEYRNGAFDSEDGFLPDFVYTLYKEITDENMFNVGNFIVHQKETDKRFCIRQVCQLCEHFENCTPTLTKVKEDRPLTIISSDISAQEPLVLSILSREPSWVNTFALKHLKKAGVLDYLQPMFIKKYHLDFTDTKSIQPFEKYYKFFAQFDWKTDRLVMINNLVNEYVKTNIYSEELENELNKLFEDYENFEV